MRVNFFVKQMQISPLYKYGMDCLVVRIALNKEASEKSLFCVCVGRHRLSGRGWLPGRRAERPKAPPCS